MAAPVNNRGVNVPILSIITALVFLVVAATLVALDKADEGAMLIGLIVSTIPSLLASVFAERTARDIRNGVMHDVVAAGTESALDKTGITEVARQSASTTPAALQALTVLLEKVVVSTDLNTAERRSANEGQ